MLVTRPQAQAQGLCQAICALGGVAYPCPMVEIVQLNLPAPGWWQGYGWLVFVSANAVRFALKAGLPDAGQFKVAAIGSATAKALAEAGVRVDLKAPAPYTSESLLAQAPLRQVKGQRILIVKGAGGRTELADTLRACGAEVQTLALYRRQEPSPETVAYFKTLLGQGLEAVLISSGEGLTNLQVAAGEQLEKLYAVPVIVGSARLAEQARQAGFAEVIEAASVLDEAMVEALVVRFGLR